MIFTIKKRKIRVFVVNLDNVAQIIAGFLCNFFEGMDRANKKDCTLL